MAAPQSKRAREGDAPAEAAAARPSCVVLELDASAHEGSSWVDAAVALFSASHVARSEWPAAVHVRNVRFPAEVAALTHPRAWDALASRCPPHAEAAVHDLSGGDVLRMPLAAWAALRRRRDGGGPAGDAPPAPADVAAARWAALLRGESTLYLSALETQTHAPEVAAAFNALAARACLVRFLPSAAGVEPSTGPILMAAEAGACSGWHRDGTRVRGAAFRAGDVNAFHVHLSGAKTWRLYAPRHSDAVTRALRQAPANAFGNLLMSAATEAALAAEGVHAVELHSRSGDVVILGKRVWHSVWTTQASVSLASDRLLPDQLPELAAMLPSFDGMPLIPAKWVVREAAASLSAAVLHGTQPPGQEAVTRTTLRGAEAFLAAQLALEPALPAGTHVYAASPPLCVSCERPHARLRYCHGCGCELFNAFFECVEEDCPWEGCAACCKHRGDATCAHAQLRPHLLHHAAGDITALVRLAGAREMQRASAKVAAQSVSAVQELTQRAVPAARNAWQRTLDRNKAFVREDVPPSVLAKQLVFTSMKRLDAEVPVRYSHLRREWASVRAAARNWRELSLGEVGTAVAFSAETFAWFCIGEIVGRGGKLTGYY